MRRLAALSLAALLTACATPAVQIAGTPEADFAGARLEAERFVTFDGTPLGLSVWPAADGAEPWAVIVAVHGVNDYAGGFRLPAEAWAAQGVTTYAYDQRGFGRSPQRGLWGGSELFTEDLRTILALARARHPHAVLAVVGESLGGAVAIDAFASDRAPDADRLIVSAPAVWGWDHQPLLYRGTLWTAAHVWPSYVLTPPRWVTRDRWATDNMEELQRMSRDPHMIFSTRIDAIYGLVGVMQRAGERIGRVRAPLLMLYGDTDQIVPKPPAFAAAASLPRGARSAYYEGGHHLLLRDLRRDRPIGDILAFLRDPAAPPPSGAPAVPTSEEPRGSRPSTASVRGRRSVTEAGL